MIITKFVGKVKVSLQHGFTATKNFIAECRRVLKVTKKPGPEEFKTIVKVSGLGILIIGLVGFLLQMIKSYLMMTK